MKKLIPFFMVLVFMFSLASISVFAEDLADAGDPEDSDEATELQEPNDDENIATGDFYTIINGYGSGYVLGYPGLNNSGDIFPIAVKNVATGEIFPSFCAYAGSRNFAGESGLDCRGYLVAGPGDLYEVAGVYYSTFISAYNYIADYYGKLDENRALTQVVTWVLLGSIDIESDAFKAIDDWKLDKDAVRDVIENYKGYTGNGNIVEVIYLLCEQHHHPVNCQPQLVPIYTSGEWEPANTEEPGDPNDDGDDIDDDANTNDDGDDIDDDANTNDDGDDIDDDTGNNNNDGGDVDYDADNTDDTEIPREPGEPAGITGNRSSNSRNTSANSNDNVATPAEPLNRGTDNEAEAVFDEFDDNQEVPLSEFPVEIDAGVFDGFDDIVPTSSMPRTGLNDLLWIYIVGLICSGMGLAVCLVSSYRKNRARG